MCHSIKSLNHQIHHITLVYKVKSAQQQVSIFKDIIKIALWCIFEVPRTGNSYSEGCWDCAGRGWCQGSTVVKANGASTSVKSTLVWFSPFKKKKPPVKGYFLLKESFSFPLHVGGHVVVGDSY